MLDAAIIALGQRARRLHGRRHHRCRRAPAIATRRSRWRPTTSTRRATGTSRSSPRPIVTGRASRRVLGREDLLTNPDLRDDAGARGPRSRQIDAMVVRRGRARRTKNEVHDDPDRGSRAVRAGAHDRARWSNDPHPARAGRLAGDRSPAARKTKVPISPIRLHGCRSGDGRAPGAAPRRGHRPRAGRGPGSERGRAGRAARRRRHRARQDLTARHERREDAFHGAFRAGRHRHRRRPRHRPRHRAGAGADGRGHRRRRAGPRREPSTPPPR